jgi:hypothetical protein
MMHSRVGGVMALQDLGTLLLLLLLLLLWTRVLQLTWQRRWILRKVRGSMFGRGFEAGV